LEGDVQKKEEFIAGEKREWFEKRDLGRELKQKNPKKRGGDGRASEMQSKKKEKVPQMCNQQERASLLTEEGRGKIAREISREKSKREGKERHMP